MWAIIPEFSLSAPESRDSTLGSTEPFVDLERSAWWKGKPRASKSWQRACKKAPWILALCGRMPGPSTASLGVERWISSLLDTPASPSATPVRDGEQTTPGTSGPMSSGSSGRQELLWPSSRTSMGTFDGECLKCSRTLPNWGSMRSGACSLRPKPEPLTAESGSSSWPTAVVGDSRSSARHTTTTGVMKDGTTLTDAMRQWPTPNACLINDSESPESFRGRAAKWKEEKGFHNSAPLTIVSKEHSPQAPKETGAESRKGSGPRLNPNFVEWLMGFPDGWTVCGHSETPSAPSRPSTPSSD